MIKIGIIGYGNLGKGVERALSHQKDMEIVGVFSKRDKASVKTQGSLVYHYDALLDFKDKIDVLILCGSSERDLRSQSPELVKHFNIVDSFDMHALILDHVNTVDQVARDYKKTALVSVGWDPGVFSVQKTIVDAILPQGKTQSFWGPGISQGHTDVAGRVEGVSMARSYSIPNQANIDTFREHGAIDATQNHHKICYVVAENKQDHARIEAEIRNIPHYFKGMSSEVRFITQAEMDQEHSAWTQGGRTIHTAETSPTIKHTVEFALKLDSNPEFTASVLVAFARATYKMSLRGEYGAFTALDVRTQDLSSKTRGEVILEML